MRRMRRWTPSNLLVSGACALLVVGCGGTSTPGDTDVETRSSLGACIDEQAGDEWMRLSEALEEVHAWGRVTDERTLEEAPHHEGFRGGHRIVVLETEAGPVGAKVAETSIERVLSLEEPWERLSVGIHDPEAKFRTGLVAVEFPDGAVVFAGDCLGRVVQGDLDQFMTERGAVGKERRTTWQALMAGEPSVRRDLVASQDRGRSTPPAWSARPADERAIEGDPEVPPAIAERLRPLDVWFDANAAGLGDRLLCGLVPELGWTTCVDPHTDGWRSWSLLVDPDRPLQLWTVPPSGDVRARERLVAIVTKEVVRDALTRPEPSVIELSPTRFAVRDADALRDRPAFRAEVMSLDDAEGLLSEGHPDEAGSPPAPDGR